MAKALRVCVLVGSRRSESPARKLARALIDHAPDSLACELVESGELPLYDEALDSRSPPPPWSHFRTQLRSAEAVLFVVSDATRPAPALLENALNVGSRGKNSVLRGLPAAVVSVAAPEPGVPVEDRPLRQKLASLDLRVMPQPEPSLGHVAELLDEQGSLRGKLLDEFMLAFERWIAQHRSHELEELLRVREQIARDYVNGEPASLRAVVSRVDPATFFPPGGGALQGAAAIAERYVSDAGAFHRGGSTNLVIMQSAASGDLAFWTGLQRAEVRLGDAGRVVHMTLRITEVFRFEEGAYKLVHRHADTAVEAGGARS